MRANCVRSFVVNKYALLRNFRRQLTAWEVIQPGFFLPLERVFVKIGLDRVISSLRQLRLFFLTRAISLHLRADFKEA